MAADTLRSLTSMISFKSDTAKLVSADNTVNSLKSNTEELFVSADKATDALDSSTQNLDKNFGGIDKNVNSASRKITDFFKKVKTGNKDSKKSTNDVGGAFGDLGKQAGDVGNNLSKMFSSQIPGGALKAIGPLGLIAAAVLAIGAAAISAGKDSQRLMKQLQQNTGKTKAELSGYTEELKAFQKQSFLSLEETNNAAGILISTINVSEGSLGGLLKRQEEYARATGSSIEDVTQNTVDLVKTWGFAEEEITDNIDKLWSASNELGINFLELGDYTNDYGETLQSLGFSFDESLGLIGNWVSEGLEVESLLDGLQEATEGLSENGINDLRDGLQKGIEILKETGDETLALTFAEQLFGKKGSKDFIKAIKAEQLALEGLDGKFDENIDKLDILAAETITFEDRMQNFSNNFKTAIAPAGEAILEGLAPVIESLTPLVVSVMELIVPLFIFFGDIIAGLVPIITPFIDILTLILSKIVPPLQVVFKVLADIIVNNLTGAFELAEGIFNTWIDIAKGVISFVTNVFKGDWEAAWADVKNIFESIFNGIANIAKTVINTIVKSINIVIGGLNKISVPDWVPGVGGKGISIPEIPLLASGTESFEGGTAIVGENGPELVSMPEGTRVVPNPKTTQLLNDLKQMGGGEKSQGTSNNEGEKRENDNPFVIVIDENDNVGGDNFSPQVTVNINIEMNSGTSKDEVNDMANQIANEVDRQLENTFKKLLLKQQ